MKRFFLISLIIVIIDQITKILFKDVHFGIFNYATNTGAAFSLFTGYVEILALISFLVAIFIIYLYKKYPEYSLPLSFVFGGAIGNLIDRVYLGYVRDFIDLKFWPIFNIADSFNVIGALLLMYLIWKEDK
jgi:signal peptidase II